MQDDDWVTGVLGSEGIVGHDYELPLMQERIGGPYELPIIGGCPPPQSIAMAGAPFYIRHGDVEFWHQRPRANRKLRSNLEAISGAMYEIECAGYEVAAATLDAYAGAMLDGWPAGTEGIETGFSLGSIVSSVTRAVSRAAKGVVKNKSVAKVVQKAIAPISKTVSSAAQTLVNGVRKYNPVALAKVAAIKAKALAGDIKNSVIFKTLSAVASKALAPALTVIKSVAGPVLPYVQSVLSFVPGVGTGISAALGAAQALADGRPIDEAIVAGAKSAIPGGPLAQMAFDSAWGLAHGRPIEASVLNAMRAQLPTPFAQRAFDTGLALAAAKTAQERRNALKTAALGALASNLPAVPGVGRFRRWHGQSSRRCRAFRALREGEGLERCAQIGEDPMDEILAVALRAFLATVGPNVSDPVTQRAIEKVDETLCRVADGKMAPSSAAAYIRDLVTVLS